MSWFEFYLVVTLVYLSLCLLPLIILIMFLRRWFKKK